MASLGSLGTPKQPVDIDFDWFGHQIRVNPIASDLIEIEFLGAAGEISLDAIDLSKIDPQATEATPEMLAMVNTMGKAAQAANTAAVGAVRQLIHPDDWDVFWEQAKANGQDLQDLIQVQKAIAAAVAEARSGFPTGQPSASSDGPTPTPASSAGVSSSPAAAISSRPAGQTTADQALAMLRGRPDLQEFVVMAEELEKEKAAKAG